MNRHTIVLLQRQVEELEIALEEKERERVSSQVALCEARKALRAEKTKFEELFSKHMASLSEMDGKYCALEQQKESLEKTVSVYFIVV